eukprot:TRINITY_DN5152_c0_g1_i2.p1 TRINITY_DN5152_c0_g1~~TRINITY_DN5152_c0_g1_i2.p1  ORF type:complete len:180 (+),score=17.02 TRINITY_DN5152_c0_g1_i2:98-637(+)
MEHLTGSSTHNDTGNTGGNDATKKNEEKISLNDKGSIELISNAANEMGNDIQNFTGIPEAEGQKYRTIPTSKKSHPKQEKIEQIKARWFMDPIGFTRCTQSPDFCQKLLWSNDGHSSTVVIMLASQTGLQILSCWGKYIMVDEPISNDEYTLRLTSTNWSPFLELQARWRCLRRWKRFC